MPDLTNVLTRPEKYALQAAYDRSRTEATMASYPIYRCGSGHSTQSSSPISKCPTCGKPVSRG